MEYNNLRHLSVDPSDIFIIMNEPPLEKWGMAGKSMYNKESLLKM
ncbi:tautomerase family protein [Butyrivibrio sp. AC2005]